MQDINELINETDTDNVILNKLKELGTKLTGQENVQGETIAEVLEFINTNYSGGTGGVGKTVLYTDETYAYKDKELTTKLNCDELFDMYVKGCMFNINDEIYIPIYYAESKKETGAKVACVMLMPPEGSVYTIYSSEYTYLPE